MSCSRHDLKGVSASKMSAKQSLFSSTSALLVLLLLSACGGRPDRGSDDPRSRQTGGGGAEEGSQAQAPVIRREAKEYFLRGVQSAQRGQQEEAIDLFKEAIDEDELADPKEIADYLGWTPRDFSTGVKELLS